MSRSNSGGRLPNPARPCCCEGKSSKRESALWTLRQKDSDACATPQPDKSLIISALALSVALVVVKPVATGVLQRVTENHWGLAPIMSTNLVMQGIVAFLLMDLSFYYWHRANHAWPLLWRFHNAHHIDPDLDVTTAVRFHFVEIGYSSAFRALQVALIGGPPLTFIAYELIFQLNTLFQHSNVSLPIALERGMNFVLVTPRMHGIHHFQAISRNERKLVFRILVVGSVARYAAPRCTAVGHRHRNCRLRICARQHRGGSSPHAVPRAEGLLARAGRYDAQALNSVGLSGVFPEGIHDGKDISCWLVTHVARFRHCARQ